MNYENLETTIWELSRWVEYMGFHEPEKFYGIVLKIPDDITTYWGADVTVTMRYIRKGDTCRTESEEFIITSEKQKIFLHSFNIEGFVPIPTSAYRILQTGDGNPVIFVKPGRAPNHKRGFAAFKTVISR